MGGRGASSSIESARLKVLGLYGDRANAERAIKNADRRQTLADIDVELYAGDKTSRRYKSALTRQANAKEAAKQVRERWEKLNKAYQKANEKYERLTRANNDSEIIPF